MKRRRLDIGVSDSSSVSDEETSGPDNPFDISFTLTRKQTSYVKGKGPLVPREDNMDDDTELEEMIRHSITRRNVKDGTELLKKTKGKKGLTKGQVGGGSFQSMGMSPTSPNENRTESITQILRAFPLDFTHSHFPRLPCAHSYPAPFHPRPSFRPTS